MVETMTAVYENGVLVPERKLQLADHAKVTITVKPAEEGSLAQRLSGRIVIDPKLARYIIEDLSILDE